MTPETASAFTQARQSEGRAPRTINSGLTAVQTMLRWAQRRGLIRDNPLQHCEKVESRRVKERRPLEDWEIPKLLEASPSHYRRIWIALLTTGLRKGELVELCWKDVDFGRGLIRVRAETCKVKREDYLPIAPELEAVLLDIKPEEADPEAHVFLNSVGTPWRHNLLRRFKGCVKAAGLNPEGLDLHALRQTYGTILASDPSNDVRTVMSLMRHSTVAMTMNLYAKPRAMRQREAITTIKLFARGKLQANKHALRPQLLDA